MPSSERRARRIRVRRRPPSPVDRRRNERYAELRREHRINVRFVQILLGTLIPSLILAVVLGGAKALFQFGQFLFYPPMAIALAYYFRKEKALREQAWSEVNLEQTRPTPDPDDDEGH